MAEVFDVQRWQPGTRGRGETRHNQYLVASQEGASLMKLDLEKKGGGKPVTPAFKPP